jgi:hypothetical protein
VAKSEHVVEFRILLTDAMIAEGGKVEVRHKARTARSTATRSVKLLLREFADRLDRAFLPVAEVVVR